MSKAARRKRQNCQLNIMNEKTFTTVTRANIFPSGSSLSSPIPPSLSPPSSDAHAGTMGGMTAVLHGMTAQGYCILP